MEPSGTRLTDTILDCLTDGVFTVDTDFLITSFNKAAEEILGFQRHQVIGRPCREVFKASICEYGCGLRCALEHDHPVMMRDVFIMNSMGERLPVSVSAGVIHDSNGEVVGAFETIRDITHFERIENESWASNLPDLLGRSLAMSGLWDLVPILAESDSSVFVEGERGTGKELVARALHELSPRRHKPMAFVECGSISGSLLEIGLFGLIAKPDIGVEHDRPGSFEIADGGTIFINEIDKMPPALHGRLLRVIQEGVFERFEDTRSHKVDVRVILATSNTLSELVAFGLFSRDLYHRVNVVKISIPPLRDRRDDIPWLVETMIRRTNEIGHVIEGVTPDVMEILMNHSYPGNVQELRSVIEHATLLCPGGVIETEHLPNDLTKTERADPNPLDLVDSLQRSLLVAALSHAGGNRRAAADLLSIHPTTLWRRARRLGVELPEIDGRSKLRRQ